MHCTLPKFLGSGHVDSTNLREPGMSNIRALEYTRQNQQQLMSILEPLMTNFPVSCFVYMELLGETEYFFLSSDPRWGDEYLMRGSPGETWVHGLKHAASQQHPTYITWSLLESKDPIEQYCVDLGYRYGVTLYKRERGKIRLWAFDGLDAQCLHFFQTQKDIIEQFIFYFDEQCIELFAEGRLQKNVARWLTPLELRLNSALQDSLNVPSSPKLFSSRFVSLHGQEGPVKLTPRQWEILKKAAQGLSMKEIGRALAISPRTVEDSLQRSKTKVGLLSRDQLSKFVNRNTIIV